MTGGHWWHGQSRHNHRWALRTLVFSSKSEIGTEDLGILVIITGGYWVFSSQSQVGSGHWGTGYFPWHLRWALRTWVFSSQSRVGSGHCGPRYSPHHNRWALRAWVFSSPSQVGIEGLGILLTITCGSSSMWSQLGFREITMTFCINCLSG
jgi:hypothetical protein